MTQFSNFRQRLDAVLRTLDVQQVSAFLVSEHQWEAGAPANPEFAMWTMIAGSPTLRDLHPQARAWLLSHGYEGEAEAVLGKKSKTSAPASRGPARGQKAIKSAKPTSSTKGHKRS